MNIFFLDKDPKTNAKYHCNKHVIKQLLEQFQMLSTAHRILDNIPNEDDSVLYKIAHKNHPSTIWARSSDENYKWLYDSTIALCDEYTYRYGKIHKSDTRLRERLKKLPNNISRGELTPPPQCMPDAYKHDATFDGTMQAYHDYYINEKNHMLKYKNRDVPYFLKGKIK